VIVEIISVGYGVSSMIGWGFGDFLAKRVLGSVGYYRLLLYTQLVSLAPVFLLAALFPLPMPSSSRSIALIVATGVCSFSGVFFFYRGLAAGRASIVTPVVSTSSVVAMALSFVILGETLGLPQILCIGLALVGILIITTKSDSEGESNAGVPYAVAAMLSIGLVSVLIKLVSVDIGEIATLFFSRVLTVLILFMTTPFLPGSLLREVHGRAPIKSIIVIGLAEFVGFFAFVAGIGVGLVSIVAPLSSASPAVTVVLAQVFLGERLIHIQKMAVVMVIAGILLLSVASI